MTTLERTVERREFYNGPPKRVSWGGIFAGAFVALAVMSVLGALGVAIGAEVIDPAKNDMPSATAYTWGAGIWWIVSGMIAIFLGALVAARLAGGSRGLEGPLHGVVTWAVVTLTTLFLLTSAIGALIGGAFSVMRTSAVVAAQGAEAAGVDIGDIQQQLGQSDGAQQVKSEASQLLRERGQEQPQQAQQQASQQLDQAIERMNQSAGQGIQPADKQEVVNLLVSRANMPQAEAQQTVDRWASQLESSARSQQQQQGQQGQQQQGQQQQQLEQKATEAAQAGVEGISTAMWAMFVYLILTLAAGAIGGLVGAPKRREGGPGEGEHRRRRAAPSPSRTGQTSATTPATSTTTTPSDRPAS